MLNYRVLERPNLGVGLDICVGRTKMGKTLEEQAKVADSWEEILELVDHADCPVCGGYKSLKRVSEERMFVCTSCGHKFDEDSIAEELTGIDPYLMDDDDYLGDWYEGDPEDGYPDRYADI